MRSIAKEKEGRDEGMEEWMDGGGRERGGKKREGWMDGGRVKRKEKGEREYMVRNY